MTTRRPTLYPAVAMLILAAILFLTAVPSWMHHADDTACLPERAVADHVREHATLWPPGVSCTYVTLEGETVTHRKPPWPWLPWAILTCLLASAGFIAVSICHLRGPNLSEQRD